MPADLVPSLVFAVLFLGGTGGLLYLMARLEPPRSEPLRRYATRHGAGTSLTSTERERPNLRR